MTLFFADMSSECIINSHCSVKHSYVDLSNLSFLCNFLCETWSKQSLLYHMDICGTWPADVKVGCTVRSAEQIFY